MNRAQRRAAERHDAGLYWRSKADWQQDVKDVQKQARRIAYQQTQIIWAAALIAAKRALNMTTQEITLLQDGMKEIMTGVETGAELMDICLSETGVDCVQLVTDEMDGEDIAG